MEVTWFFAGLTVFTCLLNEAGAANLADKRPDTLSPGQLKQHIIFINPRLSHQYLPV